MSALERIADVMRQRFLGPMIERPLSSKAVVQTSKIQLISGAANGQKHPVKDGVESPQPSVIYRL